MALKQYTSQARAPIGQATYANPNIIQRDNSSAQIAAVAGSALGQLGSQWKQQELDEKQVKMVMQQKYQSHLDDLKTIEANNALKAGSIEIESIMENNPPEMWDKLVSAKIKDVTGQAAKANQFVSPERRDFLEQQLKSYEKLEVAKMESIRLKTVAQSNKILLMSAVQQAYAEGNAPAAEMAQNTFMEKWGDWFNTKEEAQLALNEMIAKGQEEYLKQAKEASLKTAYMLIDEGLPIENSQEVIKESLPPSEWDEAFRDLTYYEDTVKARQKVQKEEADEQSRAGIHEILQLPAQDFLSRATEARQFINDSDLTAQEKQAELKKVNDRVSALMKGDFDPLDDYDPMEYRRLSDLVIQNPNRVKNSDITGARLTWAQKQYLLGLRAKYSTNDVDKVTHETYRSAIKSLMTKNMFASNDAENLKLGTRALIAFDQWAKEPRTPDEYAKFYNSLTSTTANTNWWQRLVRVGDTRELRFGIEKNIEGLEKGTENKNLSEMSDEELIRAIKGE